MSINHIVLFKWKLNADLQRIEEVLGDMRAFAGVIPGVMTSAAGPNSSGNSQAFTHAFIATLENDEALQGLGPHPAHQAMRAKLPAIMDDILVVDFTDARSRHVGGDA